MRQIEAIAFDAYGTLFDLRSLAAAAEAAYPGQGVAISRLWRAKQLEYTWLRSLMERYAPFSAVTRASLRYTLRVIGLARSQDVEDRLMQAYLRLDPFPDALAALPALRPRPLWIFSNGDPAMLEPLVGSSGLDRLLDGVISADAAGVYKPSPRCYQLVPDALRLPKQRILFVSSNSFDVAGAATYGFPTAWIRRSSRPLDPLDAKPDLQVELLTDLTVAL
ncbi:MAG: haloacid dehalogenase type II [Egibacteraceae bacterium]